MTSNSKASFKMQRFMQNNKVQYYKVNNWKHGTEMVHFFIF